MYKINSVIQVLIVMYCNLRGNKFGKHLTNLFHLNQSIDFTILIYRIPFYLILDK